MVFRGVEGGANDLATHVAVSQWALDTAQLDLAQTEATAAAKIDPKSLDAMMLSGLIAMFRKDYPTAEHYFETAHLEAPRSFAASNNLALALAEQPEEAKKRRALDYAVTNVNESKNAEAAATYGWVLYKLGRLDEADKALELAASSGQISPDTAYYIARVAVDRGHEARARQFLEGALKSTARFCMRPEAKALMEQLKK